METLGVENEDGKVVPIESNDFNVCFSCGHIITEFNDSGWEGFISEGYSGQSLDYAMLYVRTTE